MKYDLSKLMKQNLDEIKKIGNQTEIHETTNEFIENILNLLVNNCIDSSLIA